ncbi:hypothetical protein [Ochrobactrum teleogrylli]
MDKAKSAVPSNMKHVRTGCVAKRFVYSESMTTKPTKSPQEKKRLSYAKDRRNSYGENDKSSRKAIPVRKAGENRKVRRITNQSLALLDRLDDVDASVAESSLKQDIERVGGWKKSPDTPLGALLEEKRTRNT